jgi:hypothetical protein
MGLAEDGLASVATQSWLGGAQRNILSAASNAVACRLVVKLLRAKDSPYHGIW